jgi:hypothetical protein
MKQYQPQGRRFSDNAFKIREELIAETLFGVTERVGA